MDGTGRQEGHGRSRDDNGGTLVVAARLVGYPNRVAPIFLCALPLATAIAAMPSQTPPSLTRSDALVFYRRCAVALSIPHCTSGGLFMFALHKSLAAAAVLALVGLSVAATPAQARAI